MDKIKIMIELPNVTLRGECNLNELTTKLREMENMVRIHYQFNEKKKNNKQILNG